MLGWIIGIGYPAVALTAARLLYGPLRDALGDSDGFDRIMNAVAALIAGVLWPLAIPVGIIMWHPHKTKADLEAEKAELHQERAALRRRIAELERELKIGQQ